MEQNAIYSAQWADLTLDQFFEIVRARYAVYALEQRVEAEDFDAADRDPRTEHWWISDDAGLVIAYLRLIAPPAGEVKPLGLRPPDWAVGRMVVRAEYRRRGYAQTLLRAALKAHPGDAFVLHAQQYTAALYEKLGFAAFGPPFDEAGIPHIAMYRGA